MPITTRKNSDANIVEVADAVQAKITDLEKLTRERLGAMVERWVPVRAQSG